MIKLRNIFSVGFLLITVLSFAECGFFHFSHTGIGENGGGGFATESPSENASQTVGGSKASFLFHAGFSSSGMISRILKIPFNIIKTIFKIPAAIISKILEILIEIFVQLNTAGSAVSNQVVGLIKQLMGKLVDTLVSVGVLQGKTTQEVMNGIAGIFEKVISFIVNFENKISSSYVHVVSGVIDSLNIKKLITNVSNLPIVKDIVLLIKSIRMFIMQNFQNQVDDFEGVVRAQFEKHKDFFQPIFNGISSRFLIITNALHALVNGKLDQCLGVIDPSKEPRKGLQWQLNVWIDQYRVFILKLLGFLEMAAKVQDKVEDLQGSTVVPPGTETTFLTTLAAEI